MPLIKYYNLTTCYDGQREFTKAISPKTENGRRHYPDEYLVANILLKYQNKRFPSSAERKHHLLVLAEPWKGSSGSLSSRDGGKNTFSINEQIVRQIALSGKSNKNTLILAPYLYGYHHPGITIDVKNKVAIYLDPNGREAHYPEAIALNKTLKEMGFKTLTVTTCQQRDGVSCGPILTRSMIKFTEEFMSTNTISVDGFSAPRREVAITRLFQMYINNTIEHAEAKELVNEIMLADERLWQDFLLQTGILFNNPIYSAVLHAVSLQKNAVLQLPVDWENDPVHARSVKFILDFQSAITEYILSGDEQLISEIMPLVVHSNNLFSGNSLAWDDVFYRQDILKMESNTVPIEESISEHSVSGESDSPYEDEPDVEPEPPKPVPEKPFGLPYPSSYSTLIADIPDELLKAKRILEDYTKYNSGIGRFFSGHWNRHHVDAVNALVVRIGDGELASVPDLLDELNNIVLTNPIGSLAKRIAFIRENCQESIELELPDFDFVP